MLCRVTWELPEEPEAAHDTAGHAVQPVQLRQISSRQGLRRNGSSSKWGRQPARMAVAAAEDDAGRAVTGQAEQELLSCLLVLPVGLPDPAMGGWCNLP